MNTEPHSWPRCTVEVTVECLALSEPSVYTLPLPRAQGLSESGSREKGRARGGKTVTKTVFPN